MAGSPQRLGLGSSHGPLGPVICQGTHVVKHSEYLSAHVYVRKGYVFCKSVMCTRSFLKSR